MTGSLGEELAGVRSLVLDQDALVRAVAGGAPRGAPPRWTRVELRYVDLRAGRHLQVTAYDGTQAHVHNHRGGEAETALEGLLAEPFAHWHVETTVETRQLRVTRKGGAHVQSGPPVPGAAPDRTHDRAKARLLPEGHPVLRGLGISDERGRTKPSRQAKYRQVEEFLRSLDAALDDAWTAGSLRRPSPEAPLRVVDLGCGNAYLTFAAAAYLGEVRDVAVHLTGVDVKEQSRRHNEQLAASLGLGDRLAFVAAGIEDAELDPPPEVVLALHACDTATDDALARAVRWDAALVLAAPCCHHDISAQLRRSSVPKPHGALVEDGILRERFADTLTDALRASVLRQGGYRVDVMEFVESRHTPRNTLLRGVRTGVAADPEARAEYAALVEAWDVRPRLGELLERG